MAKFKEGSWKTAEAMLEEEKNSVKSSLSFTCEQEILKGFTMEVDGDTLHFSYDREAQINFQERWQLFQNNMVDIITITAHTLDGKDVRISVDKEQYEKIYLGSVLHKETNIQKLRDVLYPLVDEAKSEEELSQIDWNSADSPKGLELNDSQLLITEVKRLELNGAVSTGELMNLIFLTQAGGM